MSFNFSPKIVTDGLLLYLDAANTKSYISGSTVWLNMVNNNVTGNLLNGPSYNSLNNGSIVFDGVDDYVFLPQITNNQTIGNYSFSIWVSFTNTINSTNTSNFMLMEAQNYVFNGVDTYLYLLSNSTIPGTNGRMGFQTFNPLSTVYTTTNNWVGGRWYNIVGTYDISTSRQSIYVNGVFENFVTIANCYFNTNTWFGLGAYTANPPRIWFLNGRISNFMVHTKTLTPTEILNNYNTTKTRFGL